MSDNMDKRVWILSTASGCRCWSQHQLISIIKKKQTNKTEPVNQVSQWSWNSCEWSVSMPGARRVRIPSLTHCWVREVGRCSYVPPQHQSALHGGRLISYFQRSFFSHRHHLDFDHHFGSGNESHSSNRNRCKIKNLLVFFFLPCWISN